MTRRSLIIRIVLALLIAIHLPFPGPHVEYMPLTGVLVHADSSATAGFYLVLASVFALYSGVVFGVMTLAEWLWQRRAA